MNHPWIHTIGLIYIFVHDIQWDGINSENNVNQFRSSKMSTFVEPSEHWSNLQHFQTDIGRFAKVSVQCWQFLCSYSLNKFPVSMKFHMHKWEIWQFLSSFFQWIIEIFCGASRLSISFKVTAIKVILHVKWRSSALFRIQYFPR